jgi:hypothetical protein
VRESLTFSRDKNFEWEAVVDERALIRDGLRRGVGDVTYSQMRANLDARLSAGEFEVVTRSSSSPARHLTTAKAIEAEREILRRVGEGRNQMEPAFTRSQAIAIADQHAHLNRAQKTVVEDVLSSADRLQGIQGNAGAGKTTTLSVIRGAEEAQGYTVEGFAPTSRAARQLGEAARSHQRYGSPVSAFFSTAVWPSTSGRRMLRRSPWISPPRHYDLTRGSDGVWSVTTPPLVEGSHRRLPHHAGPGRNQVSLLFFARNRT